MSKSWIQWTFFFSLYQRFSRFPFILYVHFIFDSPLSPRLLVMKIFPFCFPLCYWFVGWCWWRRWLNNKERSENTRRKNKSRFNPFFPFHIFNYFDHIMVGEDLMRRAEKLIFLIENEFICRSPAVARISSYQELCETWAIRNDDEFWICSYAATR